MRSVRSVSAVCRCCATTANLMGSRRASTAGLMHSTRFRPSHARSSHCMRSARSAVSPREARRGSDYSTSRPSPSDTRRHPNRTELTSNNNPALALALLIPKRRKAFHWLGSAWLAWCLHVAKYCTKYIPGPCVLTSAKLRPVTLSALSPASQGSHDYHRRLMR
jgi:hypothetical protein